MLGTLYRAYASRAISALCTCRGALKLHELEVDLNVASESSCKVGQIGTTRACGWREGGGVGAGAC